MFTLFLVTRGTRHTSAQTVQRYETVWKTKGNIESTQHCLLHSNTLDGKYVWNQRTPGKVSINQSSAFLLPWDNQSFFTELRNWASWTIPRTSSFRSKSNKWRQCKSRSAPRPLRLLPVQRHPSGFHPRQVELAARARRTGEKSKVFTIITRLHVVSSIFRPSPVLHLW